MNSMQHYPVNITEEDGVFTIEQSIGATADDVVTIKLTSDQAKQIGKFLINDSKPAIQDSPELVGGFDDFWKAYPRKDGKARALDLWKRQHLHAKAAAVMQHLNAIKHTEQWTQDGGRYIPHAGTYLSQRRYLDELEQEDNSQFV